MTQFSCGILQSNYLPWAGYFDLIDACDIFVFYDLVQYTKNDWRNRNIIRSNNSFIWLTVPCGSSISRSIIDVQVVGNEWRRKHLRSLEQGYKKTPFFEEVYSMVDLVVSDTSEMRLSEINQRLIRSFVNYCNIKTEIVSIDKLGSIDLSGNPTMRLIEICNFLNVSNYISGPSAHNYLDLELFSERSIDVSFFRYPNYSNGLAFRTENEPNISFVDALFRYGPYALDVLRER